MDESALPNLDILSPSTSGIKEALEYLSVNLLLLFSHFIGYFWARS